jgi:hypothetical protein
MQRQFFEDLRELLMEFPEGLQVIVCGDFNCRLGRGQHGLVGNWSIHSQFRQTEGGLKFANKRVSSKKQVDKVGQEKGLTGLGTAMSLQQRRRHDER